jgi:O-methyltransferase
LFDTFRGFDARDRVADNAQAYAKEYPDFSDTSIESVRRLFPREAQLVFHPGWFPQTTVNVPADERFALVSLDADLYQPMIVGLNWFWERMTPGGSFW